MKTFLDRQNLKAFAISRPLPKETVIPNGKSTMPKERSTMEMVNMWASSNKY